MELLLYFNCMVKYLEIKDFDHTGYIKVVFLTYFQVDLMIFISRIIRYPKLDACPYSPENKMNS